MNKFHFTILFAAVVSAFILTGCGPYPTEQAVEVKIGRASCRERV